MNNDPYKVQFLFNRYINLYSFSILEDVSDPICQIMPFLEGPLTILMISHILVYKKTFI